VVNFNRLSEEQQFFEITKEEYHYILQGIHLPVEAGQAVLSKIRSRFSAKL
jgi:hypothetical protein